MSNTVGQFRSRFVQWADRGGLPKRKRARFVAVLRDTLANGLSSRDNRVFVETRELTIAKPLAAHFVGRSFSVMPDRGNPASLLARVVLPEWRHGWSSVCGDDDVSNALSSFFHLASQYVARSGFAAVVGGIGLAYDTPAGFVYSPSARHTKVLLDIPHSSWPEQVRTHLRAAGWAREPRSPRARTLTSLLESINALDPFVHRAIHHFVRALSLKVDHYDEEAIVALDGCVAVAIQFARERLGVRTEDRFADLQDGFALSRPERTTFERLYATRCRFAAHPAQSKWWDFSEIYEDDVDAHTRAVRELLVKLVQKERANRVVGACPPSWSEWFSQNAMMVWRSVWFDELP